LTQGPFAHEVRITFEFKGTVSPDIRIYFKLYTIKSVLFVGPIMVFICFNFVVGYLYICFNSASLEKKATGVLKLSSYCERITKAGNAVMKWIPTVTFENTFM
jgi:hypothetical protein